MTPATSLAGLADRVSDFIRRYVVLKDSELALISLWVVHTHALEAFDYTPYLYITSPHPACGKTRLLEVEEALVPKPWMTGGTSRAALMRKIDKVQPTLLFDESDAAFGGDKEFAEALRGMLNTGFMRNGSYTACDGQGASLVTKDYKTFCPKAIAGIGKLPGTVVSRSIPIELERRPKNVTVEKWRRKAGWAAAEPIRLDLVEWGKQHTNELALVPTPKFPEGLDDRAEDVLEPLILLADVAGGHWPKTARRAALALMGEAVRAEREADDSIGLELLTDIRRVFLSRNYPARIPTAVLLTELCAIDDAPWATLCKGEKLNAHKLRSLLRGLKIRPPTLMRDGEERYRGYLLIQFEDAFARYLPSGSPTPENDPEVCQVRQINGHGAINPDPVTLVTLRPPFPGSEDREPGEEG